MTVGGGGLTSVTCPKCSDDVETSLPHNAEVVSIITNPQGEEHDADSTSIERPRTQQIQCANAHTVSILYDW